MTPLQVLQFAAGDMANFSYLVYCPETRCALGLDPSFAPAAMLDGVRELALNLELLVNSHGHRDHGAGNAAVLAATGARLAGHPLDIPDAELALTEGQCLKLGEAEVQVLHTPGHTPGSICLYFPGALLTGDTLFVTRVGRADLPGSDVADLYRSLRRLSELPPETRIYPGHDYGPTPVSTLGFELAHNPYLQCPDLPAFIRLRLG